VLNICDRKRLPIRWTISAQTVQFASSFLDFDATARDCDTELISNHRTLFSDRLCSFMEET
jgi:hypothetical protein